LAVWRQTRPSGLNLPIPGFISRLFPVRPIAPKNAPSAQKNDSDGSAATTGPSRVVVRVPRLTLSWPRTLDRYVSRLFLRTAALSFLGLMALLYIGGYVDLAEKLKRPGDAWIFLNFLAQSTPQFLIYIVPVAMLVSVLGTVGGLTRTGELTVMRACGVSLYRTAIPLLAFALMGSGVLFLIEDRVLGEANRTAHVLRNEFKDHPQGPTINVANDGWLVGSGGKVYHYAAFDSASRSSTGQPTLRDLSVFEVATNPFRLRQHLHTTRAVFNGTAWVADAGWSQTFDADAVTHQDFKQATLPLDPVEDFQRAQLDPGTMRYGDLREYVKRLGAGGYNVAEPTVNLHRKIAFPMVTIVMTLLAIPFGVTIGRKGALYGIGLATILAGAYFLLTTFFVAAGSAGLLPPMLAAWAANILFGAGAAYMILTVRT
jgi:LPS export ABC transporter permease LptG